jgi:hypothetical protein
LSLLAITFAGCQPELDQPGIEQSNAKIAPPAEIPATDPATGLIIDAGWEQVQANCSACHSLSLVTQNRMTRSNWINAIRWMQKKQGLWELGNAETAIIDYLEKNYGVADRPWRRKPLKLGSE